MFSVSRGNDDFRKGDRDLERVSLKHSSPHLVQRKKKAEMLSGERGARTKHNVRFFGF